MIDKKKDKKDNNSIKSVYDKVLNGNKIMNFITGKGTRRIATVFMYERVGKSNIFEGTYPLLKGSNPKIFGEYCLIDYKGKMRFVDFPASSDFIMSKDIKLGKIVEFVKFAEDDFRVMKRFDETWYKKELKPRMEFQEVEDEETGDKIEIKAHKKDKEGQFLYDEVEVKYKEPKGITQEARDVIRQGNEYESKMQEYRKRKQGFMEKYGSVIVPTVAIGVAFMIILMTTKLTYEHTEKVVASIDDLGDKMSKLPAYADQDNINKVIDSYVKKKQTDGNPPTP